MLYEVITQPEADDSLAGMTVAQMDYKQNIERSFEKRIEQLLLPFTGGPRNNFV